MSLQTVRVGLEQTAIVIIDEFVQEPDRIVELAVDMAPFPSQEGHYYPGRRARIIPSDGEAFDYVRAICASLSGVMSSVYGVNKYDILDAGFSLVTKPPEALQPLQTIPHFDHFEMGGFAILHYLSPHPAGATAFYRHESTGFELMTPDRIDAYRAGRERDLAALGQSHGYQDGDGNGFLEIARVEARYNRAIIYPGNLLHSGIIPDNFNYSSNPRLGRLTGNVFIGALA